MNTTGYVAKRLGISLGRLRYLLRSGKISGVRKPEPGQWHLMTRDEILLLEQYVRPPVK